jgi:hypothetical protein
MQAKWTELWITFLMLQFPICSYQLSLGLTSVNYYSIIYVGQQPIVHTKAITH